MNSSRSKKISLRRKLLWLVTLASFAALFIVIIATLLYESTTFKPRVVTQIELQASMLEVVLEAPLDFVDPESAARYLQTRKSAKDISIAAIYDRSGKLFAEYHRDGVLATTIPASARGDEKRFTPRTLEYWRALRNGGHLYIQRDLPPLYARLPNYAITAGAVVLTLLVGGIILLRGLRNSIIAPIGNLIQIANQVSREQNYQVRVKPPEKESEEFSTLANAFNRMLQTIDERDLEIRATSKRIESAFSAATEVIIVATDVNGLVTLFNSGAERMLGYTADEVVGKQKPGLWHEGAFLLAAQAILHGSISAQECTYVRKDGSRFPVHLVVTGIRDENGNATGYLAVATDLSNRLIAELQLKQSEQRFRALIENSSDVTSVLDEYGVICYQSPSTSRILGFPPETFIGRTPADLIHPDELPLVQELLKKAFAERRSVRFPITRVRHADGSWRSLDSVVRFLDQPIDGGIFIVNSRDVSERIVLEEQLRQAQKLEAIGRLSGGIAHDFNNLLTVIAGNAALIETEYLDNECQQSISEITKAARRASELTRQLLTFSRRQSLELKQIDLNVVITDVMQLIRRMLREDIDVKLELSNEPTWIRADPNMMDQVLMNLCVNARDAMPEGGQLRISTEIEMAMSPDANPVDTGVEKFVCLKIRDTGHGIDQAVITHIFEPFFTTKEVGKGTGLGLATVYGIVQQHHGWVQCRSEAGNGTEFIVHIPYHATATKPPTEAALPPDVESHSNPHATILLVEDEPMVRSLVTNIAAKQGYRVIEVSSGDEAWAKWVTEKPHIDLVITDLVMPGTLGGKAFAARIAIESPNIPIIFMSGYSAEFSGSNADFKQGDNFLAKPFSPSQLLAIISAALTRSS